ncbi:hypothetical protein CsSME_00026245 [Camellia sinensis var. sinensis]
MASLFLPQFASNPSNPPHTTFLFPCPLLLLPTISDHSHSNPSKNRSFRAK